MIRIVIAFLSVPPILALAYFAVAASFGVLRQPIDYSSSLGAVSVFVLASYVVLAIIGMPLFVFAAWRKWTKLWHALLAGVLVGLTTVTSTILPTLLDDKLHLRYRLEQLDAAIPFVVLGAATGGLFWLVGIWRNPRFATLPGQEPRHRVGSKNAA